MKKILFLAPYPTADNINDGMINRVSAVDALFDDIERTYLFVSLRGLKKHCYTEGNVTIYNLNIIIHFWSILALIKKNKYIYIHSVYMIRLLWPFLNNNNKITLDIHGVVPEEERDFHQHYLRGLYYSFVEKNIFKKITNAICVTDAMRKVYESRYPWFSGKYIVYSIMPYGLKELNEQQICDIKREKHDKIEILYSGGTQGWQNIDLMLDVIQKNLSSSIHYTILTGNKKEIEKKIEDRGISLQYINIERREPTALWKDYLMADYAFILRDENIVNKVANPTKMVEYLFYGLIPIILSPNIGDYKELGYEYLSIEDFNVERLKKPCAMSIINRNLALNLYKKNMSIDLKNLILR